MTTSLATLAQPSALDVSELDLVAGGSRAGASFGGMVGFFLGEGIAIGVSLLTANPGPIIAYQLLTAAAGVAVGEAVSN